MGGLSSKTNLLVLLTCSVVQPPHRTVTSNHGSVPQLVPLRTGDKQVVRGGERVYVQLPAVALVEHLYAVPEVAELGLMMLSDV